MADGTPKRSWKKVAASVAVVLVVLVFGTFTWIVTRPGPRFPPLPNPNGYDDLVRAGGMIVGTESARWRDAGEEELRAFVAVNRQSLELARVGLGRTSRVPLLPSLDAQIAAGLKTVGPLKALTRLFLREGLRARREGRKDDAVRAGLDLVRLGHEMGRGGLIIDHMSGLAATRMGLELLTGLRADLTPAESLRVARALEAIDGGRDPIEEVVRREQAYTKTAADIRIRVLWQFHPSTIAKLRQPAERAAVDGDTMNRSWLRLLAADLAIEGYRREHEALPRRLADLVPRALAAVPVDPFGGRSLVYRVEPSGEFVLYSIGSDLKDDGGSAGALRRIPRGLSTPGDYALEPRQ
jgi:hypothetical protein